MSQFSTRNRKRPAIAFVAAATVCVGLSTSVTTAFAAPDASPAPTAPKTTVRSSAALADAAIGGDTSSTRNLMWTTFKGNAQRTGSVNMAARLPLNLQWRYTSDAEPGAITGSPLIVGEAGARHVLFNAGKNLYCLDAESGENQWTWTGDSALRAPLSLLPGAGDLVLTQSVKGTAQAIRVGVGTTAWKYQADSALKVAPLTMRTPRGLRVLLAPTSGKLIALTPEGVLDPSWSVVLGNAGAAPSAAPVSSADGKRLFVATDDGIVYCIDVRTARIAYTTVLDAPTAVTPVVLGSMMIVASPSQMVAVRLDNGSTLWRAQADDPSNATGEAFTALSAQPRVVPGSSASAGTVYAGTNRGSLIAFNARDGKPLWKAALGRSALSGSPLVLRDAVVIGSREGIVYGVDKIKGQILWRYRLESERQVLVPVSTTARTGTRTGTRNSQSTTGFSSAPYIAGSSGRGLSGGSAQATTTPITYETRLYGTSSAPAAIDGRIYILADNAALYTFSTTPFDAAPPLINDPTIVIPDTTRLPYPISVTSNFPGISNKGPVSFTLQIADAGSGIDVSKISARFNNQVLAPADMKYDVASGILSLALFKPSGETKTLSDGDHTVSVEATDYSGNTMRSATIFKVDSTFVSPVRQNNVNGTNPAVPAQPNPQQPQWGGWRGGGGGNVAGGWDPSQGPPPWVRGREATTSREATTN